MIRAILKLMSKVSQVNRHTYKCLFLSIDCNFSSAVDNHPKDTEVKWK